MVHIVPHDLGTNVTILQHLVKVLIAIRNRRSCKNETYIRSERNGGAIISVPLKLSKNIKKRCERVIHPPPLSGGAPT